MIATFLIAILIAILANVDSINLTTRLWREPDLRVAILKNLEAIITQDINSNITTGDVLSFQQQLSDISLPVGWIGSPVSITNSQTLAVPQPLSELCTLFPNNSNAIYGVLISDNCYRLINVPQMSDMTGWLIKLLGFLITGAAGSQGSSFWFDILKKIMNVRLSGLKPVEASQMVG
jgi:hypothetical protein